MTPRTFSLTLSAVVQHNLLGTLKAAFGYDAFRPHQQEIIEASLAGRDVFALLPTGGGKSLCFQIPALHREGLTIVVSPLVALMKDQVDQLAAAGIAATYLNSTLSASESRARLRGLHQGEYRLLYVAPERLMLDDWRENLLSWQVTAFAIDEAHCISEWGHDFRPEYRQLSQLRELLPHVPFMALTATATPRVREDIVRELRLRDPAVFVASFNRPNLSYRVIPKHQPLRQILDFISPRSRESGIVYCASRAAAEKVADAIAAKGYSARPYHAGLDAKVRAQNQELFLRDDVHIICATIAFGMGINKPNVRWVVHYDLPKNIEGYYQETGRAGRDGLPSECLLLFSPGDAAKQTHFLDEISDPQEQQNARAQLRRIIHYAETSACRRAELLDYFGETYCAPAATGGGCGGCGGCDNCLEPRETYDGTLVAQKLLSCVYRVAEASRFGVGLNHLIEVLTGASTDKIRRWGHDKLSTYGIGRDRSRQEWAAIGRELIRLGYLAQSTGEYPTVELTREGIDLLKTRRSVTLTRPLMVPRARRSESRDGAIACDEVLFERLRGLRKKIADDRLVPAYVIFGDATLRQMARDFPEDEEEMRAISGVGEKKLAEFGAQFLREIGAYVAERNGE